MKVTMGQVDRPSNGSLGPVPAPTLIRSTGLPDECHRRQVWAFYVRIFYSWDS